MELKDWVSESPCRACQDDAICCGKCPEFRLWYLTVLTKVREALGVSDDDNKEEN